MREREYAQGIDFHIRNIARGLRYMNDRKLAEYDITNPQARLLGLIHESLGMPEVEVNRKFLQEKTHLKGPSITSLLNGLEKKDFITRTTSAADGRAVEIEVTSKGKKLVDEMRGVFAETERQLLAGMTDEEKMILSALLAKVSRNVPVAEE